MDPVTSKRIPNRRPPPHHHCHLFAVYDMGHFLGRGAFGEIYKVSHKLGGAGSQDLALKILKPIEILQQIPLQNYDDITYRVGEIKALLLMRNVKHILQIQEFYFNFSEPQGAPLALVTELMQGEDLDRWMKGRANMAEGVTEVTASDIAKSLLSAVEHMHKRNIIHRDLKVSNLRITVRTTSPWLGVHCAGRQLRLRQTSKPPWMHHVSPKTIVLVYIATAESFRP